MTPSGIVILAHTPPPFHGQSLMVQQLIEGLATEKAAGTPIQFFHVDCKYSHDLKSLGVPEWRKGLLALKYIWQALAHRVKNSAKTLYYVPCPGKRPAFWRDCLVLAFLRPLFPRIIFHWHAAGLSAWLQEQATFLERWMGRILFSGHDTSIVLVPEKVAEVEYFHPKRIRVVPNGIGDLCPEFDKTLLPHRLQRARLFAQGASSGAVLNILYLSTATRAKGVFDAVDVWAELNSLAAQEKGPFCNLSVIGQFPDAAEKEQFFHHLACRKAEVDRIAKRREIKIRVLGGLYGREKLNAYAEADVFIFPSTYNCESFGLVLIEAAYFGLPCVTYQPLVGPEGLSPNYHRRIPAGDIQALAQGIISAARSLEDAGAIRENALKKFSPDLFRQRMFDILID